MPIYQTTSYQFNSTEHASLFGLAERDIYTRIMNPTNDVSNSVSPRWKAASPDLRCLRGAASAFAVQNITRTGDNFVASTDLYGGTEPVC